MSEKKVQTETVKKDLKNGSGLVQLTVTLCGICAVCALLLALTNMVTEPIIAANAEAKKTAAIAAEVLPGFTGTLTQVNYVGSDGSIKSVQKGSDGSFVVEVSPKSSFSGSLTLLVGIDVNGNIAGISATQSSETEGIGSRALESEYLKAQYVGKTGPVELTKNGGNVEGITGASFTSGAVRDAVNAAFEAIQNTNDGPFDPSLVPATPEPVEDVAMPGYDGPLTEVSYTGGNSAILSVKQAGDMGYVVEVDCGPDSFSKTLKIQVGIGSDRTVTGVVILESGETDGFGAKMNDVDNRLQFRGLSGTLAHVSDGGEVEGIAGATFTSKAVIKGINAALAATDPNGETPASGPAETEQNDGVLSVEKEGDGYVVVVDCGPDSFSKTLKIQVNIGADKTVTGVTILETNETPGFGAKASEPEFIDQFVGVSSNVSLTKDGGEIESIANASTTSGAICVGINAALKAVNSQG